MIEYDVKNEETAPEGSKATLAAIKSSWGFVPNLFGVLAGSPALLNSAFSMFDALSSGKLNSIEQQLVAIAAAREGNCNYCVAAHSTFAVGAKTPLEVLAGVRDGKTLSDKKLETLRVTTIKLVKERGWLSEQDQQSFFDAGYDKEQLFEVIGWVALKALTNYTNHVAKTPIDEVFTKQKWKEGKN